MPKSKPSRRGTQPFSSALLSTNPRVNLTNHPRSLHELDAYLNVYEYSVERPRRSYVRPLLSNEERTELGVHRGPESSDEDDHFHGIADVEEEGIVNDEDDEEIESDEAFGESDDDEIVTHYRSTAKTQDEETGESDVDEAGNQALENYIMDMSQRKRKMDETDQRRQKRKIVKDAIDTSVEFGHPSISAKLQLEDLLSLPTGSSNDTQALKVMKASAKVLKAKTGTSQPLGAPLPFRIQMRVERQAAYRKTKHEMEKWTPAMKLLEKSEHLSFPLQAAAPLHSSTGDLLGTFEPSNNMESAVDRLLKKAKLRENAESSQDDLTPKTSSIEEIRARQMELRRARESMSRAQVKAARMAKIKSKLYRRIQRKEKEKGVAGATDMSIIDPELAEADRLQREIERARERATLRHKNGSRWIRTSSASRHIDLAGGVNEMLQKGEALRERISGRAAGSSESSDEEERATDAVEHALHELNDLQGADIEEVTPESGVFAMKFMRDAIGRQTKAVDEDVEKFRSDLEQWGIATESRQLDASLLHTSYAGDGKVNGNQGRFRFDGPGETSIALPPASSKRPSSQGNEAKDLDEDRSRCKDIAIDLPNKANPWLSAQSASTTPKTSCKTNQLLVESHSGVSEKSRAVLKRHRVAGGEANSANLDDALVDISVEATLVKRSRHALPTYSRMSLPKAAPQIRTERGSETPTKQSLTDKARVYEPVQGQLEDTEYSSVSDAGDDTPRAETSLSQRQLVAKAFASDNVIEEFSKEKEILTARESASKMEKQPLPGWGSWTGTGIAGKRSVKVPPSTSYSGKSATRRDTGKAHVMVSEKRDLKASKYQIKDIPFPYTSRAQYERSLEVPLGTEWNTRLGHQKAVLPRVSAKMGVAIEPLEIL